MNQRKVCKVEESQREILFPVSTRRSILKEDLGQKRTKRLTRGEPVKMAQRENRFLLFKSISNLMT